MFRANFHLDPHNCGALNFHLKELPPRTAAFDRMEKLRRAAGFHRQPLLRVTTVRLTYSIWITVPAIPSAFLELSSLAHCYR